MIAGTVTLGTSQRRIGWYPRRRSAVYVTRPTRIGGITKNHFCVLSGMSGAPFGESHRSEMTSRIEYREAVKIAAIDAVPIADRIGAFAGRASRPRAREGTSTRAKIGMPLNTSPHNTELNYAARGVPAPR